MALYGPSAARLSDALCAPSRTTRSARASPASTPYSPLVLAFTISGFIAAVAGWLTGLNSAFASPELLDFSTGGAALVSTLIGGVATVGGPPPGPLLYVIGQDRFGVSGNLEGQGGNIAYQAKNAAPVANNQHALAGANPG